MPDRILNKSERVRCEIWSRVMGYFRPVDRWNRGKRQEFAGRRMYKEPDHEQEKETTSR